MEYLIYGKRKGVLNKDGEPVFDKTFRALDANGVRVSKKSDAMSYATKEDALSILNKPNIKENIDLGLIEFDIRRG